MYRFPIRDECVGVAFPSLIAIPGWNRKSSMQQSFVVFAGLAAGLSFLAAAILFVWRGKRSWPNALFALALSLTGLWALTVALANLGYAEGDRVPSTLAALRDAGWFAAIIGLLRQESERQTLWRHLALAAGILVFANLGFALSSA